MQYYTLLTHSTQAKNKLQAAATELLQSKDGYLVTDKAAFLKELIGDAELLNKLHPRCTPLKNTTWSVSAGKECVGYTNEFTCYLTLHSVKEQEKK